MADCDIFISYVHRDGGELAARLEQDLPAAGFTTWLDKGRLAGGSCRTAEIENALDTCRVVLALIPPVRTSRMSAEWSSFAEEAGDLVRECGRLPLAVAMIGAMLRGKPRSYWKQVHKLLRRAELGKIASDFPNYVHKDLLRPMQVSVDVDTIQWFAPQQLTIIWRPGSNRSAAA